MISMVMRASTERDISEERDPYGGRVPKVVVMYAGAAALPCYVQPVRERFITEGQKVMHLATHRLWAMPDADLREGDVVTRVENLRGAVLYEGRRHVRGLLRRWDHLEAMLEEYS